MESSRLQSGNVRVIESLYSESILVRGRNVCYAADVTSSCLVNKTSAFDGDASRASPVLLRAKLVNSRANVHIYA